MKDLIEALTILNKYLTDDEYFYNRPTNCEHEELYVSVDNSKISEEDMERLIDLGFIPDEDTGYMASYRYGSN